MFKLGLPEIIILVVVVVVVLFITRSRRTDKS